MEAMKNFSANDAVKTMMLVVKESQEKDETIKKLKEDLNDMYYDLVQSQRDLVTANNNIAMKDNEFKALSMQYSDLFKENTRLKQEVAGFQQANHFISNSVSPPPPRQHYALGHPDKERVRRVQFRDEPAYCHRRRSRSRSPSPSRSRRRSRSRSRSRSPSPETRRINRHKQTRALLKVELHEGYIAPALVVARCKLQRRLGKSMKEVNTLDIRSLRRRCNTGKCSFDLCRCKTTCRVALTYSQFTSLIYACDETKITMPSNKTASACVVGKLKDGAYALVVGESLFRVSSYGVSGRDF